MDAVSQPQHFDTPRLSAAGRDELARRWALTYAASTMHFVRWKTVQFERFEGSGEWRQKQFVTYHGHPGKPPLNIDAAAQERFVELVARQPPPDDADNGLGELLILGEEATVTGWDPDRPGRTTILRADPIDGTSSLAHCGDGFATVVTVESRRQPGADWKHLGGAIVRSDGLTVSWSRTQVQAHHVVLDLSRLDADKRPNIIDLGPIPPFAAVELDEDVRQAVATSGASVAAHSSKRREALRAKFPDLQVLSNHLDYRAGTTAAWQLCNGMLGFIVELNATTIHDSAHLLPYTLLGGNIVTHEYEPVRIIELIQDHADPTNLEKVVPPYIAFTDRESLEIVKAAARADGRSR
ncbi:hypothetical protein [Dactylosporangium maewongense]|uniref:hypothetical protein n=1 Tax=Dactylosporangium TaxID=35753 RepID=UPI0031E2B4AC